MPSSTFLNLPAQKQEKLLEAATREFSQRPHTEASINQIIKDAGIPRGSFYMYFTDKEELFRYVLSGYVDQMVMVLEEALLREHGDIFAALLRMYDYTCAKREEQGLGGMGAMTAILSCNSGIHKNTILAMVDTGQVLRRLKEQVNPDVLDLRREGDLGDMLGILLTVTAPLLYAGIQAGGAPDTRERLKNMLEILRRGMGLDKGQSSEARD